ncbi:MAG: radical SAM protein, partial [Cyclonatronaceae bacterium]
MTIQVAPKPFHVLAKPIGPICNLDCEYCFYLEKENLYPDTRSFKMSDDVLEEFTRQYITNHPHNTREINFAWQGGEPTLMGVDFFRRALMYQKKYARPGLHFLNSIQTNGTRLDDDWGKFLKENDFL